MKSGETELETDSIVTYKKILTPKIYSISPTFGTSAGGTPVTIKGEGFHNDITKNIVTIDKVNCQVVSSSETEI